MTAQQPGRDILHLGREGTEGRCDLSSFRIAPGTFLVKKHTPIQLFQTDARPSNFTEVYRHVISYPNALTLMPSCFLFLCLILTQGHVSFFPFLTDLREIEREKHQSERETLTSCLSDMSQPGTEPTTSVCALTRNQTCNFLVSRVTLEPTNQVT